MIDGDTLELIDTVEVGRRPRGITLSKDQSLLYVCVGDSDRVDVIDLATNTVIDRLPSGPDPELFVLGIRTATSSTSPTRTTIWSRWST